MRLTYIFAAAASLLGLVTAVPAQHVDLLLKTIADKERELIRVVDTITVINAPLILVGQGPFPTIITGLMDITADIQMVTSQIDGEINYSGDDRDTITEAFSQFSKYQMELLSHLIGKGSLVAKVSVSVVGEPVATALQNLEAQDDALTVALINHMDDSGSVAAQGSSMGNLVAKAIEKYHSLVNL